MRSHVGIIVDGPPGGNSVQVQFFVDFAIEQPGGPLEWWRVGLGEVAGGVDGRVVSRRIVQAALVE